MAVFYQMKLLLRKYFLLRRQQPVLSLLEVLWPILMFMIVAVIRFGVPPIQNPTCHYEGRDMPSSGMVGFLQSFVCNLNNKCQNKTTSELKLNSKNKLALMFKSIVPTATDPSTLKAFKSLKTTEKLVAALDIMMNTSATSLLDDGVKVSEMFKEPDKLRDIMVNKLRIMSNETANNLLGAKINIVQLLSIFGYRDLKGIICNATELQKYVIFRRATNVSEVSASLCRINSSYIPDFVETVQNELKVSKIMTSLAELSQDYDFKTGLKDLASLIDMVSRMPSLSRLLNGTEGLASISEIFLKLPLWIKATNDLDRPSLREVSGLVKQIMGALPSSSLIEETKKDLDVVESFFTMFDLDEIAISLWKLTSNRTSSYLRKHLGNDIVDAFLGMPVNVSKLDFYSGAGLINATAFFCSTPGLREILNPGGSGTNYTLSEIQDRLCSLPAGVLGELARMMHLEDLSDRIPEIMVKELVKKLSGIVNETSSLLQKHSGVVMAMERFKFKKTLDAFLAPDPGSNYVMDLLRQLDLEILNLQGWDKRILFAADKLVDFLLTVLELMDSFFLQNDVKKNATLQHIFRELFILGPNATKAILSRVTEPDQLMMLLSENINISQFVCENLTNAVPNQSLLDKEKVKLVLCNKTVLASLQRFMPGLPLNETKLLFEEFLFALEHIFNNTYLVPRTNILKVFNKTQMLLSRFSKLEALPSGSWGQLLYTSMNSMTLNVSTQEWKAVWNQLEGNSVLSSVLAMILSLESTVKSNSMWKHVEPWMQTTHILIEKMNEQQRYQNKKSMEYAIFMNKIVKLMKYSPELIQGMVVMITDPVMMNTLMASSDLVSLFCGQNETWNVMNLSASVPRYEIQHVLCGMNLSQMVMESYSAYDYSSLSENIKTAFNMTVSKNLTEMVSWKKMINDLKNLYQNAVSMPENTTRLYSELSTMLMSFNVTALQTHLIQIINTPNKINTFNEAIINMEVLMLKVFVDGNVLKSSEKKNLLLYLNILDFYLDASDDGLQNFQNSGIGAIFNSSLFFKNLNQSVSVYFEFMEMLLNKSKQPEKLIQDLTLSIDLKNSSICKWFDIADLFIPHISNTMPMKNLKMSICTSNTRGSVFGLNTTVHRISTAIHSMIHSNVSDIKLNWTQFAVKIKRYYLNQSMPPSFLSMLKQSAVWSKRWKELESDVWSKRWKELESAVRAFKSVNYLQSFEDLLGLLNLVTNMSLLKDQNYSKEHHLLIQSLNMNLIIQQTFYEFLNKHLQKINGSTSFNLLEYFQSKDLRKLFEATHLSPTAINILLDTVYKAITTPNKILEMTKIKNWEKICSNITIFKQIFVTENLNTGINVTTVHSTICKEIVLKLNFTTLLQSLEKLEGFTLMMMQVKKLLQMNLTTSELTVNYTAFMGVYQRYLTLISAIGAHPPQFELGWKGSWMNKDSYSHLLKQFVTNMDTFTTIFKQSNNYVMDLLRQLDLEILNLQGWDKRILFAADKLVDFLLTVLELMDSFFLQNDVKKNATLQHIFRELFILGPNATKAILSRVTEPDQLMMLLSENINISQFVCENLTNAVPNQSLLDKEKVKLVLCNKTVLASLQRFMPGLPLNETKLLFEEFLFALEHIFNNTYLVPRTNILKVFNKTQMLLSRFSKLEALPSGSWGQLLYTSMNSMTLNVSTQEWKAVWNQLEGNSVLSSVLAMILSLESTVKSNSMWKHVEPWMQTTHILIEKMNEQQRYQNKKSMEYAIFMNKIVKLMKYSPELIQGMVVMITDPVMMNTLMASSDLVSLFCGQNETWNVMNLSASVPRYEIQHVLCGMNLSQMIMESYSAYDYSSLSENIKTAFNMTVSKNLTEMVSWKKMINDLKNLYQNAVSMPENTTRLYSELSTMLMSFNVTALQTHLIQIINTPNKINTFNEAIINMEVLMLKVFVDGNVLKSSEKKNLLLYLNILDFYLDASDDGLQNFQNSGIGAIFNSSLFFKNLNQSVSVYFEFMEMLLNKSKQPEKLIQDLTLSIDLKNSSICKWFDIADLFIPHISNTMPMKNLKMSICTSNTRGSVFGLNTTVHRISTAIHSMIHSNVSDIKLNWTQFAVKIKRYYLNQSMPPSFLSMLKQSAVWSKRWKELESDVWSKRWKELESAVRAFKSVNYLQSFEDLLGLLNLVTNMSLLKDQNYSKEHHLLIQSLNMNLIIQQTFYEFLNKHLQKINGSTSFNLLEYFQSKDLRKLFEATHLSPTAINILLDTVYKAITTPNKILEMTKIKNWEKICSNITIFKQIFVTENLNTGINVTTVHSTICKEIVLKLNFTTLLQSLEKLEGFTLMMMQVKKLLQMNLTTSELTVNYTAFMGVYQRYLTLISAIGAHPPQFELGWKGSWMNKDSYSHLLKQFVTNMDTFTTIFKQSNVSKIWPMIKPVFRSLELRTFTNLNLTLSSVYTALSLMESSLKIVSSLNLQVKEAFGKYPEILKLFTLFEDLPEALSAFAYNSMFNMNKIISSYQSTKPDIKNLCHLLSKNIVAVPGSSFDMQRYLNRACALNVTAAIQEFEVYQQVAKTVEMASQVNEHTRASMDSLLRKVDQVWILFRDLTNQSHQNILKPMFTWMTNASLWNSLADNLHHQLTVNSLMNRLSGETSEQLSAALSMVPGLNQMFKVDFVTLLALDILLDKIEQLSNDSYFRLEDFFVNSSSIQKVILMLQKPGVMELLVSINPNKLLHFSNQTLASTLEMICRNSSGFYNYFISPVDFSENLTEFMADLCNSTMLQMLPKEIMREFRVEEILSKINSNYTANLTEWMQWYTTMNRTQYWIKKWTHKPPTVILPKAWNNTNYWLKILQLYQQFSFSHQNINYERNGSVVDKDHETRSLLVQLLKILSIMIDEINTKLFQLQDGIMLQDMFGNGTIFDYIQAFQRLEKNIFGALKRKEITPKELVNLMLSRNDMSYQCEQEILSNYLLTFTNSSQLIRDLNIIICFQYKIKHLCEQVYSKSNFTNLTYANGCSNALSLPYVEAMGKLVEVEALTAKFSQIMMSNNSGSIDWKAVKEKYERLQKLITDLLQNPPSIHKEVGDIINSNLLNQLYHAITRKPYGLLDIMPFVSAVIQVNNSNSLVNFKRLGINSTAVVDLLEAMIKETFWTKALHNSTIVLKWVHDFLSIYNMQKVSGIQYIRPLITDFFMMPEVQAFVCNLKNMIGIDQNLNTSMIYTALCRENNSEWSHILSIGRVQIKDNVNFAKKVVAYLEKINMSMSWNVTSAANGAFSFFEHINQMVQIASNSSFLPAQLWTHLFQMMKDPALNRTLSVLTKLLPEKMKFSNNEMFWSFMKYIKTTNEVYKKVLDYVNGSLVISLHSILSDPTAAQQFLTRFLSPQTADKLLAARLNPFNFFKLELRDIACNASLFNQTILLSSVDLSVEEVQSKMCAAVLNSSLNILNFTGMLNMKTFVQEVMQALSGYPDNKNSGLTLQMIQNQLMKFKDNIKRTQQVKSSLVKVFHSQSFDQVQEVDYFNNTRLALLCSSALSLAKASTIVSRNVKTFIVLGKSLDEILKYQLEVFPVLETVLCGSGNLLTNIFPLVKKTSFLQLINMLKSIASGNASETYNCNHLAMLGKKLPLHYYQLIKSLESQSKESQCLRKKIPDLGKLALNLDSMFVLSKEMLLIVQDPNFQKMVNDKTLVPFIEVALSTLLKQKPVVVRFSELFKNSTSVFQSLQRYWSVSAIEALFNSSINLKMANFLSMPPDDIKAFICSPGNLSEYIEMAMQNLTVTQLFNKLCKENITEAIILMKASYDSALVAKQLLKFSFRFDIDLDWLKNTSEHIASLLKTVQPVLGLQDLLLKFNINRLQLVLPDLQRLLLDNVPQRIVDGIVIVMKDFKKVANDSFTRGFIGDLEVLTKGLLGLNSIKKLLAEMIVMKDFLKDPDSFFKYLTRELGVPVKSAHALFNSSISFAEIINMSKKNLTEWICNPKKLKKLLKLNSPNVTAEELSDDFCKTNLSVIGNLTEALVKQVKAGKLIQQYVSLEAKTILRGMNVSVEEMQSALKNLQDTQGKMNKTFSKMNLTEVEEFLDYFNSSSRNSAGGQTSMLFMQKMTRFMCGFEIPLKMTDEYGLTNSMQNIANDGMTSEQELDMMSLPNQFCKDMFRMVLKVPQGFMIWKYLKPLIRGKILFTPDNSMTREIISEIEILFDSVKELHKISKDWQEGLVDVKDLADMFIGKEKLMNLLNTSFVKGLIKNMLKVDANSLIGNFQMMKKLKKGTFDKLQHTLDVVVNYSSCLSADRLQGVHNETDMERHALNLTKTNDMLAAVIFLNMDEFTRKKRSTTPGGFPKHIHYKIRMDIENVPKTGRLKERFWRPRPEDNFVKDLRYLRGFIQLQEMLERAMIKKQIGENITSLPEIELQQMPFPCHQKDNYLHVVSAYLLPLMMTLAWLATLGIAIRYLVEDQEDGQEEALKVMGMYSAVNWCAWFISTMLMMILICFIIVIILHFSTILRFSDVIILFLYFVDFCLSTTMMCYMVSGFFTQATLAVMTGLIVYLLSYLPYIVLQAIEANMMFWQKILVCLSSTTAFSYGSQYLSRFEEEMIGIKWSNINRSIVENDQMNFSWACIMMLIDSVIYFAIGWYIRKIKKKKYGIAQPWYFLFSPSYWTCSKRWSIRHLSSSSKNFSSLKSILLEDPVVNASVGISLRSLTKNFSKFCAVDNLTIDFYSGEITSLLGHNGAGKTTALNMLTGISKPTSGVAEIFATGSKKKQKSIIGICPQQNIIFKHMSVEEHLRFYTGIKAGISGKHLDIEVRSLLKDVDLWHMKDVPAKDLSGGMKRRLCVALAFAGSSEIVILDEPTSGVDPSTRRSIWDLILKYKKGCTVLLTTHHLDEADILSDRVAILHHGQLLCCGSPLFLKRHLGQGYHLTVVKKNAEDSTKQSYDDNVHTSSEILEFIQAKIPETKLTEAFGSEVSFVLPMTNGQRSHFPAFFKDLDENLEMLQLSGYGVSDTTLEEVFFNACSLSDAKIPITTENMRGNISDLKQNGKTSAESVEFWKHSYHSECQDTEAGQFEREGSLIQTFAALFIKRFHHYRRNWRMFVSVVFLPCVFFTAAMGFSQIEVPGAKEKSLLLTPAMYGKGTYMFYKNENQAPFGEALLNAFTNSPGIGTTCMKDFIGSSQYKCIAADTTFKRPPFTPHNSTGCQCKDSLYTCAKYSEGIPPPQLITNTTDILLNLDDYNVAKYLLDSYYKFIEKRYGGWTYLNEADKNKTRVKIWFKNKGHHALPAFLNAYSNALLRAHINATVHGDPADYGISVYSHPMTLAFGQLSEEMIMQHASETGVSLVILLAFSFVPAAFAIYLVHERISVERHLQFICGVGPFTYWFTAFVWDMLMYCISVLVAVIVLAIFKMSVFWDQLNLAATVSLLLLFGWAAIPLMYTLVSVFKNAISAYLVIFSINVFIGLSTNICVFLLNFFQTTPAIHTAFNACRFAFLVFPQYCLGYGLVTLNTDQLKTLLFQHFGLNVYENPFSFSVIAWPLISLALEGIVFLTITLVLESRKCCKSRSSHAFTAPYKEDEDVQTERIRIERRHVQNDVIYVHNLGKVFRRHLKEFLAVDGISFGVKPGQCFGLLGVNGAGKTTTFRMLTADLLPSCGDIKFFGQSIIKDRSVLNSCIGYCPQENGLDLFLTGEELLVYYARLKGIPSHAVKMVVADLVKRLELESKINKLVCTYSGGTKRKLSVAIALLGNPSLVFLDEPTTGMDPGTRRLVWNIINQVVSKGQSVILTSHSMEECDILCTSLSIMVNGQFKCLGSPQHLKNKYGKGYTVILRVKGPNVDVSVYNSFMNSKFFNATLKDCHNTTLEYTIPKLSANVSSIFGCLEASKQILNIEDYAVTQTTLDMVFIGFASKQSDGLMDDTLSELTMDDDQIDQSEIMSENKLYTTYL